MRIGTVVEHKLFGRGRVTSPVDDQLKSLGRFVHVIFDDAKDIHGDICEGSFDTSFLTEVESTPTV